MHSFTKTLFALALILIVHAAYCQNSAVPSDDMTFVNEAAKAGMAEVTLGRTASDKASAGKVKDFAKMMIADHEAANTELKNLASKKNITLPAESECEDCKQKNDELSALSGQEFDKKYIAMMVSDHKKVVEKFTRESSEGKDPEIKAWAASKLPTLKHHLSMAESLNKDVSAIR
jgi:putative membrane protein